MSALEWHLPVGIQVYHYGVPGRDHFTLDNPVICQRPVLSLDPMALVTTLPTTRLSVHDRQRRLDWPVEHRLGRFLIYRGADGWPRFCYADGERFSLITPMEVTPVSLKEALDFVRQYHRHCLPAARQQVLRWAVSRRWHTDSALPLPVYLRPGR